MTALILTLTAGPLAIIALAFGPSLVRLAIQDHRARRRQRVAKRHGGIDRERAAAIGIGGASDFHGEVR